MKILVTGSNGQLGKSIQKITNQYPNYNFLFTDVKELDITDLKSVKDLFQIYNPDFCINAAAYTLVDKAEEEQELNKNINQIGPKNLAIASNINQTKLIHISSDYVYDNNSEDIMNENSPTTPKGEYATSKLNGELEVIKETNRHFIIRTSWLYSEFGNNFVKTMIRLGKERESISVVNDQIGSPTYATDLASAILDIITENNNAFGIYNYSNKGFISWFDFTKEIFIQKSMKCQVNPIPSSDYPTKAPRPLNSRMSKDKITNIFKTEIPLWKYSLSKCLINL